MTCTTEAGLAPSGTSRSTDMAVTLREPIRADAGTGPEVLFHVTWLSSNRRQKDDSVGSEWHVGDPVAEPGVSVMTENACAFLRALAESHM